MSKAMCLTFRSFALSSSDRCPVSLCKYSVMILSNIAGPMVIAARLPGCKDKTYRINMESNWHKKRTAPDSHREPYNSNLKLNL